MTDRQRPEETWSTRRERGSALAIRVIVWVALHLGRRCTRVLLYPICLYFLAFSSGSRAASGAYLRRVLARPPRLGERFRHYFSFASCALDRVYLLNDDIGLFDIRIAGEELANTELAEKTGSFLFGAHIGSFEILRALGHRQGNVKLSLLMYEDNARKINSALGHINPDVAIDVIPLGRPDSMLTVGQRLDQGHVIGILADRGLSPADEEHASVMFLGDRALFPLGPFRLAALLRRPIYLMIGLYRGGRRYDVHFERVADFTDLPQGARQGEVDLALRRYVARLEYFCRQAPYNWFNFYDFWK
jgi:predicted LPLAT superfamily acyltransferase